MIESALISSPTGGDLLSELKTIQASLLTSTQHLQDTSIATTNIIQSFKDVDEATIKRLNSYYARHGASWSVENLSWSADYILNTCEDSLRDKVREGLVGVNELENGGPLVLKKMLDIVMNVDDDALRSLTEGLQSL